MGLRFVISFQDPDKEWPQGCWRLENDGTFIGQYLSLAEVYKEMVAIVIQNMRELCRPSDD